MTQEERLEELRETMVSVAASIIGRGSDRDTAEDAVQEAFIRVCRYLHEVAPENLRGYVFAAVRNSARNARRKLTAYRNLCTPLDLCDEVGVYHDPTVGLMAREVDLSVLTTKQRQVMELLVAGEEYVSVAAELRSTVSAVRLRAFRARRRLLAGMVS